MMTKRFPSAMWGWSRLRWYFARPGAIIRMAALILLLVQLGVVAHRIEHYFVPEQMECGEDSCAAFTPTTGASDLAIQLPALGLVYCSVSFWAVADTVNMPIAVWLGFKATAPPV